ncbi:MAG: iron ABC transporter permease [Gemmatimonadetes bacterium]|nr:iron ABC transporter permease [Gemmatimonadota bacterium]
MTRSMVTGLLLAVVVGAIILSVRFGAVPYGTTDVLAALAGQGDETTRTIVRDLRLPRALLASFVGGGLALAGAAFQALLRNPLAEPYILGVSGGAAVGAVIAIAAGAASAGSWALPLMALAGALLAVVLVFRIAAAAAPTLDVRVLLLAGVVVAAFFNACIMLVLSVSEAAAVRSAVLWMMGSLAGAGWSTVLIAAAYTLPCGIVLVGLARALNLLAIGEETASYLGTDTNRIKRIVYAVASLVTAAGVAVAGVIGFVGLIVPHAVRMVAGSDHRVLLPASFAAGAAFLTLADLLARTVWAPTELPIGVITAFVGVPFFLALLGRGLSR